MEYTLPIIVTIVDSHGEEVKVAVGLTGNVQGENVFDLVWDENSIGKYLDPEKYRSDFMAAIERMNAGVQV